MAYTNNNGQSRVGVRMVPQVNASSLWNSIYSVYNADAVGSSSLKTSLFAAYNFDNNLNDAVGSKNGTGYGGISYTTGIINQSVGFNGANSYVELPNSSGQFNFTDDFSISLWVKPYSTSADPFLINNYLGVGSNYYGYYLYIYNNTGLRFGILNGTNTAQTNVNQLPPSNVWTHIVITRKKSTITKIYYNGVLMTPSSSTNPTLDLSYQPNTTTTLGAEFGNYKYSGWMDSLNFWTKELTSSEVTELYNSGNGVQYTTDNFYKQTTNDALNTYNGTAQGGLTYGVGKVGTAFQFNGTNAYVQLGDVMDVGLSSWSYAMWFKANQLTDGTYLVLFSKSIAASGAGRVWVTTYGNQLQFNFDAAGNTNNINTQTTLTFNTNTWYHIVCVLDRNDKLKMYVNGTLVVLNTILGDNNLIPYSAVNYNTNNPFRIGTYTAADNTSILGTFNGSIDAFNIWNRVLNASEITELYNSGNGKQYPN